MHARQFHILSDKYSPLSCVSACLPLLYPSILLLLVEPNRTYLGWEIAETCWSGITSKWMCGFIWEIACTNSEVAPFRRVMIFTLFDTLSHLFSHPTPTLIVSPSLKKLQFTKLQSFDSNMFYYLLLELACTSAG